MSLRVSDAPPSSGRRPERWGAIRLLAVLTGGLLSLAHASAAPCEQPVYVQAAFALDRVRALAPAHPEWNDRPVLGAVIRGDLTALSASGERGAVEVFAAHLQQHSFKTFLVSGGGVEFMRVFAERVYGIPPEQVVGSTGGLRLDHRPDGTPVLQRLASVDFVDDRAGKPVTIQRVIGRRPIFAIGNSDGDRGMLEWTAAGAGHRVVALVHHTDAAREYAYDRHSPIGRLDTAWDQALARGWTVIDMKTDWRRVFAFE